MTREEQIKEASQNEMMKYPNFCISAPAFRMGAEWADAHQYWVSVEEALPKVGEWVLIYVPTDKPNVYTTRVDIGEGEHWRKHHNVTHWMPLPAPPKKGEQI